MAKKIKKESCDLAETLSEAAWQRLRSLALATARYESIVPLQEVITGEGDTETSRRDDLQNDPHALAESFLLLILRELFDPHNAAILRILATDQNELTIEALADATGQPALAVRERISALIQSGFVQKDFDSGKIFLTSTGENVTKVLETAISNLTAKIKKELSEILGKAAH